MISLELLLFSSSNRENGYAILMAEGMVREIDIGKENLHGLEYFFTETFGFTDEQTAAIEKEIPMTQELYDSILDRCGQLGSGADRVFYRLLAEYSDFMVQYAEKLQQELNEKYPAVNIPEDHLEKHQLSWEQLCAKIRERYGEDAI